MHRKFCKNWRRQFRSYKCKKIQNKDEKHLPWILCRGLGMFLKQLDQFMLQYYSFKAENIAKQQKCWELWQYTWRHRLQLGLDCDVRKFPIQLFYNPWSYLAMPKLEEGLILRLDLTFRHTCVGVRFGFKKKLGSCSEGSVPVIFISMTTVQKLLVYWTIWIWGTIFRLNYHILGYSSHKYGKP
jgi:hypothetical protein